MTNQTNDQDKTKINLPPPYKPENKFWYFINSYRYVSIPVTILVLGLVVWGISVLVGVLLPEQPTLPANPPIDNNPPGAIIDRPTISNITVRDVTDSSAAVYWDTNLPANGSVEFWSADAASKMMAADDNYSTSHNIVLNALNPDTTYNIVTRSTSVSGYEAFIEVPAAFTTGPRPVQVGPEVGYIAPGFTLQDINDKTVSLTDFQGKWVMLEFWDMDCDACRSSMTPLQMYYQTMPREKIELVSVNVKEKDKMILISLLKARAITYPVLLDTDGAISDSYKIGTYPTTFFIDPNGVIRKVADHKYNNEENVAETVNSVLGN